MRQQAEGVVAEDQANLNGGKMNKILMAMIAALSFFLVAEDTEAARRLGGGKNLGTQRQMTQPPAKSPTQQAPAATPATPQPQSGMSKWLGPLAGLALGAGLASLFMNNGLAGAMGGILMMLLLAAAVVFAIRFFRSRHQQPARPLQYAGASAPAVAGPPPGISNHFGGGAAAAAPAAIVNRFPPGFDAEQFAHHAKLNFTQLQESNDKGDLSAMRDFMTPALYAEIEADIRARGDAPQKTDVVTLNADVQEVVTEGDRYVASVRFDGMIRENPDAPAEPFSEVWHLEKPVNGRSGWVISGIQQL
jgi:predicted lipid-binding transport protein (Tim44 family)